MAQVLAQKCSLCDEQNGAYYCYECQQGLCTACHNRHGKIPALSGHTVADINTVDLSTVNKKSHCLEHEKEFLFYCVKCDTFICSKCITSTHYTHPFSEITEIVVKERQKAKENIKELKLKIDAISTLQEKVKTTHFEQLHSKSKQCIEHIESVSKDLQSCIESKRCIKATEVEDNEKNEQENLKAFADNTDSVHKQYTQILSELENVLLERHDVTFYSSYRSIDSDIQTLVNIPEEPEEAQVPIFKDRFLYQEVQDYMESKIDKSLCQNCSVQKRKIEDLQSENKRCKETLQRDLERKDDELRQLLLKESIHQADYTSLKYQKDSENKKLGDKIKTLNKELEKKKDEIKKLSREIHSSKERVISGGTREEEEQQKRKEDTAKDTKPRTKAKALYQFDARNHDELTLIPGDIILILADQTGAEPGWLGGEKDGKTGWFPEAYIEHIDSSQPVTDSFSQFVCHKCGEGFFTEHELYMHKWCCKR